jgi:hypothetical protein
MTTPGPRQDCPDESGYLLSFSLVAVLVALMAAALSAKDGRATVLLGVYMMAWGCMFLASYYFSHKSAFLRGLVWFCEKLSYPGTRKMAFFYFVLAFGMGATSVVVGLGA